MQKSKVQFKSQKFNKFISTLRVARCALRQSRGRKGFTMVELLIYMGILSIFLGILTSLFSTTIDTQLESQAYSSVDQDGRYILSRLTYDAQRALSITTPSSLGTQTTSLQLSIGGVTYTYALQGSNLQLTNNLGTDTINSFDSTVSNLTFKRLGNVAGKNSLQISFTLTSITAKTSGPESRTFQTTIGTR